MKCTGWRGNDFTAGAEAAGEYPRASLSISANIHLNVLNISYDRPCL
jgi:hypothetical protein